ncbi:phosphatidylserine lipase ABHD16A isoform X1 [Harmonia axyridis]|uniref:phosphatidylserine lipase ABHD16A isoform X1 n=2 Tax=Harmonia axyridis TaxID=115357 RepID=UPI001E275804|nr:phosphatidylserine lipase ABHD16A isoform X1 [Harmonia axyridis]
MSLSTIWKCMFSPRLIKVYGTTSNLYQPSKYEKWGDQFISSLCIIWKLGLYTSPFIAGILYHKDYFTPEGLLSLTKFVTSIGVILVISYISRGLGRAFDDTYKNFIKALDEVNQKITPLTKQNISCYDFEFHAWPVEYDLQKFDRSNKVSAATFNPMPHRNLLDNLLQLPFRVAAAVAIHTFGIRLIYPGSLGILKMVLDKNLIQGRTRYVEYFRGERFKIRTYDGNDLDTMFVDKRMSSPNGNTLVICCEGNAGFYEIGIMGTPLEAGFSALGWNHPGFGGSTGTPYPPQEQNAIDGVMQFAVNKLGFRMENIIIFAWSIGGYSATWAAMNYPEIKGLVLDATFDDIVPLAVNQMPTVIGPIVDIAIREHANLNVAEQLVEYPGPVLLIRRTADEIICTKEGDITSNRGNFLLKKLLWNRYPLIFGASQMDLLEEFLSLPSTKKDALLRIHEVNDSECVASLQSYISEYSKTFPLKIGEEYGTPEKNRMAIFLANKHLKDFKSSHCTMLPPEMFQLPWEINVESDFVFT